jgi:hypothetical protein
MLEKTEGAIKNEQSRAIDNIGQTRHLTKIKNPAHAILVEHNINVILSENWKLRLTFVVSCSTCRINAFLV